MKNVTAETTANKNYLYFTHESNNLLAAVYDVRNVDDIVSAIVDTGICKKLSMTAWLTNLRYIRDEFGDIGYDSKELKELAQDPTSALKVVANIIAVQGYAYFTYKGLYATLGNISLSDAEEVAQSRKFPGAVPIENMKASMK